MLNDTRSNIIFHERGEIMFASDAINLQKFS